MAKVHLGNNPGGFPIYAGSVAERDAFTDATPLTEFWTTDGNRYLRNNGAWFQTGTDGAKHEYEASLGAGDEGISSPNLSLKRGINRAHCCKLASSASAQIIGGNSGVPIYVKALRLMGTSTGTITIAGFSTPTGLAALANTLVIPAIPTAVPIDLLTPGIAHAFAAGCTLTRSGAAQRGL